mmetsp:Transcript_33367/g.107993  ORF Transcript_33367/g.107993 Transcript_33367/m.107993 type:complete len:231 (+) Transcript_33367:1179-1871(+)
MLARGCSTSGPTSAPRLASGSASCIRGDCWCSSRSLPMRMPWGHRGSNGCRSSYSSATAPRHLETQSRAWSSRNCYRTSYYPISLQLMRQCWKRRGCASSIATCSPGSARHSSLFCAPSARPRAKRPSGWSCTSQSKRSVQRRQPPRRLQSSCRTCVPSCRNHPRPRKSGTRSLHPRTRSFQRTSCSWLRPRQVAPRRSQRATTFAVACRNGCLPRSCPWSSPLPRGQQC